MGKVWKEVKRNRFYHLVWKIFSLQLNHFECAASAIPFRCIIPTSFNNYCTCMHSHCTVVLTLKCLIPPLHRHISYITTCRFLNGGLYLHLQRPNHNLSFFCVYFCPFQPLITQLKINLVQVFHLLVFDHLNYYPHLAANEILPHFFFLKRGGTWMEI